MRTSKAIIAVVLLFTLAFQNTVEAKTKSSGSRSRGRGSGSSHSSHSSHSGSSNHHTSISHPSTITHQYKPPPAPKPAPKPAPPSIGWNIGGGNSLAAGHSTGSHSHVSQPQKPTNNHISYPIQSKPTGLTSQSAIGTQHQSHSSYPSQTHGSVHTPIHATAQNQVHSSLSGQPQSNIHTPIQATRQNQIHSSYPVQSYHPAPAHVGSNTIPAGATYYHSANSIPAGATFYPHAGVVHAPVYHSPVVAPFALPPSATYYASPAAIPAGAIFYQQPPRTSSGPGFGTGLIAGAIGQSMLDRLSNHNHYHDRVVHHYDHNNYNDKGEDKIIIINNGPAGSVESTPVGQGTTIIQAGVQPSRTSLPQAAVSGNAYQNLNPPIPAIVDANVYQNPGSPQIPPIVTNVNENMHTPKPLLDTSSNILTETNTKAPGGVFCMPIRINDTDPQNSSNIIEVEKIACYLAPTEELQANETIQQLPAGGPVFGNDQSQFLPSETFSSIDEMNKQKVLPSGINQNYVPPSGPLNPVQTTRTPNQPTLSTAPHKGSSASVGIILSLLVFCINF